MSSSLRQSLGENEVFELVCDYLRSRKFYESEKVLVKERKENLNHYYSNNTKSNISSSKLENLLESSYVTSFVSGGIKNKNENNKELTNISRKRICREHLDGNISNGGVDLLEEIAQGEEINNNNNNNNKESIRNLHLDTKIISFESCKGDPHGSAIMPIYQTSTFAQISATEFGQYDYTRSGNPTRSALERQMANIENGKKAFAFTSGMAAISTVARLATFGDEIIICDDSYGGTYRLLTKIISNNGVKVTFLDLSGKMGPKNLKKVISCKTKLIMIESPSNPMQRICDINEISKIARQYNAFLSVDNTMLSPILQNPLNHGADIVIHSGTKFICGHSDTMSGIVIAKDIEICKKIYFIQNAEGTGLAPFDCWLLLRGIKTMSLRVLKSQNNAEKLANYLNNHPAITHIYYTGINKDKNIENLTIHNKQAIGYGSVICIRTGSLLFSQHIVTNTKLFKITVSFGSVHSLISLPCVMSHASIPEEIRKERSFPEDLIRLSIGIENVDDLIYDLSQAIKSYKKLNILPIDKENENKNIKF